MRSSCNVESGSFQAGSLRIIDFGSVLQAAKEEESIVSLAANALPYRAPEVHLAWHLFFHFDFNANTAIMTCPLFSGV